MQKILRSIAADKKRVQAAEAAGTAKTIGSGTKDKDNKSQQSNGGKHTLASDRAGNKSNNDGKQPPNKQKKVDIGK
eukprot:13631877-Ditylum_brightwellii.AAC.1